MAIVYLEELGKQVSNKYLAVNVIAKRARALNDELLGAGLSKKQKPVSVATEELAAGELTYNTLDPNASEPEAELIFTSESDGFDAVDGDEQIAELFGESLTEASDTDEDVDAEDIDTDTDEDVDAEDIDTDEDVNAEVSGADTDEDVDAEASGADEDTDDGD
ncbi:DNA-directed RNA polymerase subunit omega [Candidatus Poribacteria bacterium]|nr:MAG: DNA-directed RNA polymerase subunit omega [Candidatus Poribacteria bacterium]